MSYPILARIAYSYSLVLAVFEPMSDYLLKVLQNLSKKYSKRGCVVWCVMNDRSSFVRYTVGFLFFIRVVYTYKIFFAILPLNSL